MEANKVIFEHQVRKVIRQELINVLSEQGVLNEGIFDRIIKHSKILTKMIKKLL